jgi:Trk K+ transport system NAD-binding subunit
VYEALLERDLLRETPKAGATDGTLLVDLAVESGAPFDGKRVRDLGLPPGCILIVIRRGSREEVPNADSLLSGGDQITALIGGEATPAVRSLREGTGALPIRPL